MKILDDEERNAHWNTVLREGAKGCVVGFGCAGVLVSLVKKRYPAHYMKFNSSIKAAMWAMPTISMGAFFADDGSWKFDEEMYRGDYYKKIEQEKLEKWNSLSNSDKAFTLVNDNKYKIIVSAWAASLYGSWYFVNKDKYMTVAQKAVQARVYAQAITVVLLLGTLLLNMHERELQAKEPAPVPEWKRYLDEQEAAKQQKQKSA